jgi:hypothetical protein
VKEREQLRGASHVALDPTAARARVPRGLEAADAIEIRDLLRQLGPVADVRVRDARDDQLGAGGAQRERSDQGERGGAAGRAHLASSKQGDAA